MEIKTKYSVGDTLWTIDEQKMKVASFTVTKISVTVTDQEENGQNTSYYGATDYFGHNEQRCFPTREALLEQLGV